MAGLSAFAVGIDLPAGWDGEIYAADAPEGGLTARTAEARAVVHAATFPLPPERGDFGSGAVELMRPGDVFVIVFEYLRDDAGASLFAAEGVPDLTVDDFSDRTMPRRIPGVVGAQRFFSEAGRAFCIHALLGARRPDQALVAMVNSIAATITIE